MPVLNTVSAPDTYDGKTAIMQNVFGAQGGWFSVVANDAFVELQYSQKNYQGSEDWTQEIHVGSGAFASVPRTCIGMQFRNALAGNPAIITAQIAVGDEPPLAISALGNVSATLLLSQIPRVITLPVAPQDQQVVVYLVPGFTGIEWLLTWNNATGFWDVIGGPPLSTNPSGNQTLSGTGQFNLAAGPSITLPNKGDYSIKFGLEQISAPAGQSEATVGVIGSVAGLLFNTPYFPPASIAFFTPMTIMTGYNNYAIQSFNISIAVATSAVNTQFANGYLEMMPRRIQ